MPAMLVSTLNAVDTGMMSTADCAAFFTAWINLARSQRRTEVPSVDFPAEAAVPTQGEPASCGRDAGAHAVKRK
jgi:hypothetical protein